MTQPTTAKKRGNPMTTESANEFIRVRDAATEGPWWQMAEVKYGTPGEFRGDFYVLIGDQDNRICTCHGGECNPARDSEFICHARNTTLPEEHLAALAELERVKNDLAKLMDHCDKTHPNGRDPIVDQIVRERIESEVGE